MHPYSTKSPWNPKLIAVLAITSTLIATSLGLAVNAINNALGSALVSVSAMTVFGILYFVFDRYLWRPSWVRHFLLVPDLNGDWHCEGRTLAKGDKPVDVPWVGTLSIRQSWTRLAIVLKTSQSISRSFAAALSKEAGVGYRLVYNYDNEPSVAEKELNRHFGVCKLIFSDQVESAEGDYFTDRDRMTVGIMKLQRKVQ